MNQKAARLSFIPVEDYFRGYDFRTTSRGAQYARVVLDHRRVVARQSFHMHAKRFILVSGQVYDVTEFLAEHPGGSGVLLRHAGKDATAAYELAHGPEIIQEGLGEDKKLGAVDPSTVKVSSAAAVQVVGEKPKRTPLCQIINLYDFEVGAQSGVRTRVDVRIDECKGELVAESVGLFLVWGNRHDLYAQTSLAIYR